MIVMQAKMANVYLYLFARDRLLTTKFLSNLEKSLFDLPFNARF